MTGDALGRDRTVDNLSIRAAPDGLLGAVELTLVISISTAAVRAWLAGRRDIGAGWLIGLGLGVIAPSAIYLMMSFGYLGRWPTA